MIVKMKKITLMVLKKELESGLENLRDLGLLHITEEKDIKKSDQLFKIGKGEGIIRKALGILPVEQEEALKEGVSKKNILDLSVKIISISEERDRLIFDNSELERKRIKLTPWGDFNPLDLEYLVEQGIYLNLLILSRGDLPLISDSKNLFTINKDKDTIYAAYLNNQLSNELEAKRVKLPKVSLSSIKEEIIKNQKDIKKIESKINEFKSERNKLVFGLEAFHGEKDFELRKAGIWDDEEIVYLSGYICKRDVNQIKSLASDKGWGIVIKEPDENDDVPTLTDNPKWIKIIQPVFNMLGIVPGYNEFDISSLFLIFLSIFFAMIIGDAGYGFIFLSIAVFANIKQKGKNKEPIILLFVLSISTIIWGTLTGTWFGSETLANLQFFKLFRVEAIYSFNENSGELIKKMTFIIGTIHLSIARLKKFLREFPALKSFGQIGWWSIVIGLYYLVLNIVLNPQDYPFTSIHMGLLFGGISLVIIFEEQDQRSNFFKGLLKGLLSLPLKFLDGVGAFSDIISYIRLFAVGLATVEIAKSFNLMAEKMSTGTTGLILAIFVLIVGHSLNIAMSALSVIVHGVRLKMLEFSGHLGMEWKGHNYEPFKKSKIIFKKE